jgi:hypothetical protein
MPHLLPDRNYERQIFEFPFTSCDPCDSDELIYICYVTAVGCRRERES